MRALKQFIHSPFFNKRQDIIDFFELLAAQKKNRTVVYTKEDFFEKVYTNEAYNEEKLFMLYSRLYRLVDQFLAFQQIKQNKSQLKLLSAQAYRQQQLEPFFKKSIQAATQFIEKEKKRDANYLKQRFEIEYELYDFIESQTRSEKTNLQLTFSSLDHYFISQKLKLACLAVARKTVYKKNYDTGLLTEVLSYIEDKPALLEIAAIAIYYHCYKAITNTNNEFYFRELRTLISKHKEDFQQGEVRDIILLAINYCIKQLNAGNEQYGIEIFELYRNGIEEELLFENNQLSRFTFNNAITIALRLKQYEWIEKLIHQYQEKLPTSYRTSFVNYNLGRLFFSQGFYEKAMQLILNFNTDDYLLNLRSKALLIKIYYKLGPSFYDPLESLLNSMRSYLNRKDMMSYHKTHLNNFIRFMLQLINLTNKKEKKLLYQKTLATSEVFEKDWLLEQLV